MNPDPFELLWKIEQECRAHARPLPRDEQKSNAWMGIGFLLNNNYFVSPLVEIKEVVVPKKISPLPSNSPWFLGITEYQGTILPVTDLQGFLFDVPTTKTNLSRLVVINVEQSIFGFLVQEVVGIQRFFKKEKEFEELQAPEKRADSLKNGYQGSITEHSKTWTVLSLKQLSQSPDFYHILKEMVS